MPNTFFRFKQFTVHQDRSAMKICTDACLFGAWVANQVRGDKSVGKILDIGSGTGLLGLMLAQAVDAQIDAVEIDADAYQQTVENFKASPWTDRMHVYNNAVQQFQPGYRYNFIISNPPFYDNDLRSPDNRRNLAHHSIALKFEELLNAITSLLAEGGRAALLLPYEKYSGYEKLIVKANMNIEKKVAVKQSQKHNCFRVMYLLNRRKDYVNAGMAVEAISIKDASNNYTNTFSALLSDYYL